jgi:4-hydroxybenzoyl-CoA reductase subunit beta
MILPRFEYRRAKNIDDAIHSYAHNSGKVCYLAGGTDLIPSLKLRLSAPAAVIDLKHIKELKTISRSKGWLVIGANVTLFDLKNDPEVKKCFPALYESLDATSCETLQMRGTIGGNILQDTRCLFYNKSIEWRTARGFCHKTDGNKTCSVVPGAHACFSNYCSDNALSLITLSARVKLIGLHGERTVALEKIFSGNGAQPFTLEPGEILTEIRVPLKETKGTYEKLRVRNSMDYPLVGVAVSAQGPSVRCCVGGIGPSPRFYELDNVDANAIKSIADRAYADAKPVANATLTPAYRKKMVGALLKRAIEKVQGGAR